jgi:outer membrane protein TolC
MHLALLAAKLDIADTVDERISILESQLKIAHGTRELVVSLFEMGRISPLDVLQAESVAQRIEIELLQQRRK